MPIARYAKASAFDTAIESQTQLDAFDPGDEYVVPGRSLLVFVAATPDARPAVIGEVAQLLVN